MFKFIKFIIFIALIAGIVYLGHGYILTKTGELIYKKDVIKPVDVIVVLAGEETERVEHGVKLFKENWARKDRIIMAGGPLVWKYSWASLMKEHAEHLGVPAKAIQLQDKSRSTEEDALYTKEILKRGNFKSILLVTSPYHSMRASLIFSRILGDDIKIINAPAENSWFSFNEWWKRRRDRAQVLNELSKFIWLWVFGVQTSPSQ